MPNTRDPLSSSGRKRLSYTAKGYNRTLIFLGTGSFFLLVAWLSGSWLRMVTGIGAVVLFYCTILDALFVVDVMHFRKLFEYDENTLYITRDGVETVIPFLQITELKLAYGSSNTIRGWKSSYLIRYSSDGSEKEAEVAIYPQSSASFSQFQKWLKRENPAVKVVNWATSGDVLVRLFRKRK